MKEKLKLGVPMSTGCEMGIKGATEQKAYVCDKQTNNSECCDAVLHNMWASRPKKKFCVQQNDNNGRL